MTFLNWIEKLQVTTTEEEDGSYLMRIEWDNEDPDLGYWTNLGEDGRKAFIIDALTNALACYVD